MTTPNEPRPNEAAADIFDRLMALWQQPWSEPAYGEAQSLISRIRTALAAERAAGIDFDQVLLEAAHYNVFQSKKAHANLRMVVDAARDSAARLAAQSEEPTDG